MVKSKQWNTLVFICHYGLRQIWREYFFCMVSFAERLRPSPSGSHQMGGLCKETCLCACVKSERELERGKEHVCAHRKERGRVWVRAQMMLLVEGDGVGFGFPSCATRFSPLRFDLCVLSVWHFGFLGKSCSLFATGIRAGCCKRS